MLPCNSKLHSPTLCFHAKPKQQLSLMAGAFPSESCALQQHETCLSTSTLGSTGGVWDSNSNFSPRAFSLPVGANQAQAQQTQASEAQCDRPWLGTLGSLQITPETMGLLAMSGLGGHSAARMLALCSSRSSSAHKWQCALLLPFAKPQLQNAPP